MLDCPLRDEPYSVNSPLMDILLNPRAKTIANRHLDGLLDKLPPFFASTEAPSFSAIMDLTEVAAMGGMDPTVLPALDRELAQLEVTDTDRAARCRRYDDDAPDLTLLQGRPRLLLFQKITGFRDGPSVEAATAALYELARENGWSLVETDRGGVMTNIVNLDVTPVGMKAPELAGALSRHGIKVKVCDEETIRMVTHNDVQSDDIEFVLTKMKHAVGR